MSSVLMNSYKRHEETSVCTPGLLPEKSLSGAVRFVSQILQIPGAESSLPPNSTCENLLKLHCCLQYPKGEAASAIYLQSTTANYFSHPNTTPVCGEKASTYELNLR